MQWSANMQCAYLEGLVWDLSGSVLMPLPQVAVLGLCGEERFVWAARVDNNPRGVILVPHSRIPGQRMPFKDGFKRRRGEHPRGEQGQALGTRLRVEVLREPEDFRVGIDEFARFGYKKAFTTASNHVQVGRPVTVPLGLVKSAFDS